MIIEKYVKVGERGQIAIPKEMRDNECIEPQQLVKVINIDGEIIIRTQKREKSAEERILELLQKAKLGKEDWKEIQKDRSER